MNKVAIFYSCRVILRVHRLISVNDFSLSDVYMSDYAKILIQLKFAITVDEAVLDNNGIC